MNRIRLAVALALGWAASASADDWGEVAQISTTLGVQANRLCLGEASRGDIGCPTYAPYVSATSGYVGIGTANPSYALQIENNSLAFSNAGTFSWTFSYGSPFLIRHNSSVDRYLALDGSSTGQAGFLVEGKSGLGMATGALPSTTLHVSGTIRMANGGEACDADRAGAVRWHEGSGQFQVCYGSGGWALLSSAAVSGTLGTTPDRIVSGTSSVIANGSANGGYISLTAGVGGTEWGYLGSSVTYLPLVTAARVSSTYASLSTVNIIGGNNHLTPLVVRANGYSPTVILERNGVGSVGMSLYTDVDSGAKAFGIGWVTTSNGALSPVAGGTNFITLISDTGRVGFKHRQPSTTVDIAGTVRIANGGETCDANRSGAIRWHESAGQFQVCYGSGGWALLSSAAVSGTLGATPDRIVSGTTSVIAGQDRSVTISTAGSSRVTVGENGYVGIGTLTPLASLDLRGNYFQRTSSDAAGVWQLVNSGSAVRVRFDLNNGDASLLLRNNSNVYTTHIHSAGVSYFNGGNVGISTTNPSKTLTVNGDAAVSGTVQVAGTGAESCTMGTLGQIRLNPTSGKFEVCRQ